MSDRKYPDIDFVETDTETIESNLIALYENMVQQVPGRERYKVYPASPERLFIAWVANIIVHLHGVPSSMQHQKKLLLSHSWLFNSFHNSFLPRKSRIRTTSSVSPSDSAISRLV